MLRDDFRSAALVPVNNEQVLLGEIPPWIGTTNLLDIAVLPGFLKTYIERQSFSFTHFLRTSTDKSSELYQWILNCFVRFRELGVRLAQHRL
jgi:hypothetical protein